MMAEYGYLNHAAAGRRDSRAIRAIYAALPYKFVTIEQPTAPGENDRPSLQVLIDGMQPLSTLCIYSLDQLGRDTEEVVKIWEIVTVERRAHLAVLDTPILDTRIHPGLSVSQVRMAADQLFAALREEELAAAAEAENEPAVFEDTDADGISPVMMLAACRLRQSRWKAAASERALNWASRTYSYRPTAPGRP